MLLLSFLPLPLGGDVGLGPAFVRKRLAVAQPALRVGHVRLTLARAVVGAALLRLRVAGRRAQFAGATSAYPGCAALVHQSDQNLML